MTIYRIAKSSGDYRKCYNFVRSVDRPVSKLTFPTVYAENDGGIVSVLGRAKQGGFPRTILYFNLPNVNPAYTLIRQLSLYEAALMSVDTFVHFISIKKDPEWLDMLETVGFNILNEEEDEIWLHRDLINVK
jgi:hypothetical protein|tara:strand:+ start:446 stop:841 length:396 start_codon:yes stop_codon:yes gene_type:complete